MDQMITVASYRPVKHTGVYRCMQCDTERKLKKRSRLRSVITVVDLCRGCFGAPPQSGIGSADSGRLWLSALRLLAGVYGWFRV